LKKSEKDFDWPAIAGASAPESMTWGRNCYCRLLWPCNWVHIAFLKIWVGHFGANSHVWNGSKMSKTEKSEVAPAVFFLENLWLPVWRCSLHGPEVPFGFDWYAVGTPRWFEEGNRYDLCIE